MTGLGIRVRSFSMAPAHKEQQTSIKIYISLKLQVGSRVYTLYLREER
jgi:hypothetical protein